MAPPTTTHLNDTLHLDAAQQIGSVDEQMLHVGR
jgi:hypothetical protein